MDELRQHMMQLTVGYWVSKAIYCAARADVADGLAGGPRPVSELAAAAGVDADALHRVLRALASLGIFAEGAPGVFGLTPRAELLRADHPQTMKHFALMACDDLFEAWADIWHSVETGGSAVERRFGGDFFARIGRDAQKSRMFDRAMEEIHGGETALMLAAFDFGRFATVLDVGGGNGSTLHGILAAHPGLAGRLFELPAVIESARAWLADKDTRARVELSGGDFFQEIPGAADCIVLRHVLHDWSDEQSVRILRAARAALAPGGSLLVVEKVVRPGNDPEFVKLLDLNMLAIGGLERTEEQYRALLAAAGLRLHAIHETPGPIDLVEARVTGE